jgi:hypothetical protein
VDNTPMGRLVVDDTKKGRAVDIQTEDSDWPQKIVLKEDASHRLTICKIHIWGSWSLNARNHDNGYKRSIQFGTNPPKHPPMLSTPRKSAMMVMFCSKGRMFVFTGGVNNKSG